MRYSVQYTRPDGNRRKHCSKGFDTAEDAAAFVDQVISEYGDEELRVMKEITVSQLHDDSGAVVRGRLVVNNQTEWISTAEAAEILGVGRIRVTQLINAGQLRAEKVGNRYSVDRASVEERAANPPKAGRRW